MEKEITIKKSSCSEYWEGVPDILDVCLSPELLGQIEQAREFMRSHRFVKSAELEVPWGFYVNEEQINEFQEAARFDVDTLIVYDTTCYLYVQSKWDWQLQAEFEIPV